jgi:hypothetical protein
MSRERGEPVAWMPAAGMAFPTRAADKVTFAHDAGFALPAELPEVIGRPSMMVIDPSLPWPCVGGDVEPLAAGRPHVAGVDRTTGPHGPRDAALVGVHPTSTVFRDVGIGPSSSCSGRGRG